MTPRPEAGWSCALLCVAAVFCYGQALQSGNGFLTPLGIRYLAATLILLLMAVAFPAWGRTSSRWQEVAVLAGGAVIVFQLAQLAGGPPALALQRQTSVFVFATRLIVFGVLGVSMLSEKPLLGRWHGLAFAAAFVWLSRWLLVSSPNPPIDVTAWTNHALRALGQRENPWNIAYPNIYHHTKWYAPGIADENWVHQGYPYPPFSLELSGAGYLVGDMRWTSVALLVAAALACQRTGVRMGAVAAALLLTTPRILFIVEQAWTDSYVVGLLALVCWSYFKWKPGLPYLLGLLLVSKQYAIFFAPLIGFLIDPGSTRKEVLIFLVKVAAAGILPNLPFIALGPIILFKALTVTTDPFRPNALSFLAATASGGQPTWPIWIQVPLLIPAYALVYFRGPRGPTGFALGSALVICVFFAFSKHAFANHHFLALGSACVALATMLDRTSNSGQPLLTNR